MSITEKMAADSLWNRHPVLRRCAVHIAYDNSMIFTDPFASHAPRTEDWVLTDMATSVLAHCDPDTVERAAEFLRLLKAEDVERACTDSQDLHLPLYVDKVLNTMFEAP